jgi:hypothetical protein
MKSRTVQGNRLPLTAFLAILMLLISLLVGVTPTSAQTQTTSDPWAQWKFLVGTWASRPDSTGAVGGTTFSMELQNRIMVRKNFAKYPASKDRPAINHEDLFVIYAQPGNPVQANYWDNEGHVIHYEARFSDDSDTLRFTSDVSASSPRFRLSYIKMGGDSLKVDFEFAKPDKPDLFQPYLTGILHKKL